MDAVKFIKERDRMCKSYYDAEKGYCSDGCPAHDVQCSDLDGLSTDDEELVTLVEKWSAAHPRKTRKSVFLEQYPNAKVVADTDIPCVYPCDIEQGMEDVNYCESLSCYDCRREFWMQEVE